MTAVLEPLVPGDYTSLIDLNIRSQMDTESNTNLAGVFKRGAPFVVFEVYPEKNGIVWGRVSSNLGSGKSIYVGLRVYNQDKAHLENAFLTPPPQTNNDSDLVKAIRELTAAIRDIK